MSNGVFNEFADTAACKTGNLRGPTTTIHTRRDKHTYGNDNVNRRGGGFGESSIAIAR